MFPYAQVSDNDIEVLRRLQGLSMVPSEHIDPQGACFGSGMLHFYSSDVRATIDKLTKFHLLEIQQRVRTIDDFSKEALKQVLSSKQMAVSGRKSDLLKRIKDNLSNEELEVFNQTSLMYTATLTGSRLIRQSLIEQELTKQETIWRTYNLCYAGLIKRAYTISNCFLLKLAILQNGLRNFSHNPITIQACTYYWKHKSAKKMLRAIIITAFLFNTSEEMTKFCISFLSRKLGIDCTFTQLEEAYKETFKISAIHEKFEILDLIRSFNNNIGSQELIRRSISVNRSLYGSIRLNSSDPQPILYFGEEWEDFQ